MGSKRPEQSQLLSTDHKTRTNDEHILEEDKQNLHIGRGKLGIPQGGENPALQELKDGKNVPGKKG